MRATNSVIEVLTGPSFQDGSWSVCATAVVGRSGPIRVGSTARVESTKRRLMPMEEAIAFMFAPFKAG